MQIFIDPVTRLPRLEEHDSPWQHFQDSLQKAGFHLRPISFEPDSATCPDPPLALLAACQCAAALATFCAPLEHLAV